MAEQTKKYISSVGQGEKVKREEGREKREKRREKSEERRVKREE